MRLRELCARALLPLAAACSMLLGGVAAFAAPIVAPGELLGLRGSGTDAGLFRVDLSTGAANRLTAGDYKDFHPEPSGTVLLLGPDSALLRLSDLASPPIPLGTVPGSSVAADAQGRVFVAESNAIVQVDRSTGAVLQRYEDPLISGIVDLAVQPDGTVVALRGSSDDPTDQGVLVFLDPVSGNVRGIRDDPVFQASGLGTGDSGITFVSDDGRQDGSLSVFDATANALVNVTDAKAIAEDLGLDPNLIDGLGQVAVLDDDHVVLGLNASPSFPSLVTYAIEDDLAQALSDEAFSEIEVVKNVVPEPTTALLLAAGLAGLAVRRRRLH